MRQQIVSPQMLRRISLFTLELKLYNFIRALERRYNPDWPAQPRVPAGEPIGPGRWTAGGGSFGAAVLVAANAGYPVNLLDEEARGAHVISEHVAVSQAALLSKLRDAQMYTITLGASATGLSPDGSFTSLEAATKLVNSTVSQNQSAVARVARGEVGGAQVQASFSSPTGYEAYADTERSSPYIRNTYRVRVVIRHDPSVSKGYSVVTAFPTNRDW